MTKTLKTMKMLNDCRAEWHERSMKELIEKVKNGKGMEGLIYCGAMESLRFLNIYHVEVITPLILSLLETINELENQCKK